MRDTVMVLPRRPLTRLAAALIAVAGLAGCSAPGGLPSTVASTASEQVSSPDQAATPDQTATPAAVTTPDAGLPAVVATPEVSPAPETSPQPTLPALSAAQQEKFGGCLTTAVTHWSSGACAALAQETLAGIGFLAGEPAKRIDVRGANAILNYQRSRGLDATGTIDEATWRALATNQSPRSTALPAECLVAGTVLCVDQGARTLRYVVDGTVERTVQVRLGGCRDECTLERQVLNVHAERVVGGGEQGPGIKADADEVAAFVGHCGLLGLAVWLHATSRPGRWRFVSGFTVGVLLLK